MLGFSKRAEQNHRGALMFETAGRSGCLLVCRDSRHTSTSDDWTHLVQVPVAVGLSGRLIFTLFLTDLSV